ncbi:hypothetical protein [Lactiplantibacillus plantarum]|uniref:hypothetical protein n=1 Tax=Lactiplantibacillus plantarum TaxID=1590 RepID=UPI000977C9FF|nr:hypothetical protein [Lactiplantibacillus plantarum]
MTKNVIKLEIPSDSMTFSIGGEEYTVSFADKSFALFSEQYDEIKMAEVKLQQELQHKAVELNDKQAQAENDMVNEPMTKLDQRKQTLERHYIKIYDKIQNDYKAKAKERFYNLLDAMFGKGSGEKIYHSCNDSMIVLAKVVAQIMINIENNTDIQDYRDKYLANIKALRKESQEEQ